MKWSGAARVVPEHAVVRDGTLEPNPDRCELLCKSKHGCKAIHLLRAFEREPCADVDHRVRRAVDAGPKVQTPIQFTYRGQRRPLRIRQTTLHLAEEGRLEGAA